MNNLHQYVWLNHYRNDLKKGDSSLCIIPSNYTVNLHDTYLQYFSSAKLIHTFQIEREHETVRYFNVYLLTGYRDNDEAHYKN